MRVYDELRYCSISNYSQSLSQVLACKFIIESIVLSLTWLFPSNEDAQFVNSCACKPYWRVRFHEIGLHYDTVCPFLLKGFFIKTNGSYLICTCRHKNPSEMCRLLRGNLEFILLLWRLGWPSKEKDPMPSAIVYELKKKKVRAATMCLILPLLEWKELEFIKHIRGRHEVKPVNQIYWFN